MDLVRVDLQRRGTKNGVWRKASCLQIPLAYKGAIRIGCYKIERLFTTIEMETSCIECCYRSVPDCKLSLL